MQIWDHTADGTSSKAESKLSKEEDRAVDLLMKESVTLNESQREKFFRQDYEATADLYSVASSQVSRRRGVGNNGRDGGGDGESTVTGGSSLVGKNANALRKPPQKPAKPQTKGGSLFTTKLEASGDRGEKIRKICKKYSKYELLDKAMAKTDLPVRAEMTEMEKKKLQDFREQKLKRAQSIYNEAEVEDPHSKQNYISRDMDERVDEGELIAETSELEVTRTEASISHLESAETGAESL